MKKGDWKKEDFIAAADEFADVQILYGPLNPADEAREALGSAFDGGEGTLKTDISEQIAQILYGPYNTGSDEKDAAGDASDGGEKNAPADISDLNAQILYGPFNAWSDEKDAAGNASDGGKEADDSSAADPDPYRFSEVEELYGPPQFFDDKP